MTEKKKKPTYKILNDVKRGYSTARYNNETIYLKHFDLNDNALLEEYEEEETAKAASKGALSKIELLEIAKISEKWSDEMTKKFEDLIADKQKMELSIELSNNKNLLGVYKKQHEKVMKDLYPIAEKYRAITYYSSENIISNRLLEYRIYLTFHKDPELKEKLFSHEVFFEFDHYEALSEIYFSFDKDFSVAALQKVALSPIFQNLIRLTENHGTIFLGAISDFTYNQLELLINGDNFSYIIKNSDVEIPKYLFEEPKELLRWWEAKNSQHGTKGSKPPPSGGFSMAPSGSAGAKHDKGGLDLHAAIKSGKVKNSLDLAELQK